MVVTQFRTNRPNRSVNTNNLASLKWCIVSEKVNTISGTLLNFQSIVNKTQDLQVEIATNNYDLCALRETWIKEDDTLTSHRICPPGYNVTSVPRTDHMGGGIAIVHKTGLSVTLINLDTTSSMEYAEFKIANQENDQQFVHDTAVQTTEYQCSTVYLRPSRHSGITHHQIRINYITQ